MSSGFHPQCHSHASRCHTLSTHRLHVCLRTSGQHRAQLCIKPTGFLVVPVRVHFSSTYMQFIITLVETVVFTNIRVFCCRESWNLHKHEDPRKAVLEVVGCFCSYNDVCAGYDVTTSK